MALLTVNSADVYLDAQYLVISHDLVVAEAYCVLDAEAIAQKIGNQFVYPNDAESDFVASGEIVLPAITIAVAEAYSSCVAEVANTETGHQGTTDPDGAYLPGLQIEAQGDYSGWTRSTLKSPGLEATAFGGGLLDTEDTFPTIECSATGSSVDGGSLERRTPTMTAAGFGGGLCGTLKVPDAELSATGGSDLVGTLSAEVPPLSISAEGYLQDSGSLSKYFPTLSLSATTGFIDAASLSERLPPPKLSASGSRVEAGTLEEKTPIIQISATGYEPSGTLSEKIPVPWMLPATTGYEDDRFDSYVLRYAR